MTSVGSQLDDRSMRAIVQISGGIEQLIGLARQHQCTILEYLLAMAAAEAKDLVQQSGKDRR